MGCGVQESIDESFAVTLVQSGFWFPMADDTPFSA